MSSSHSSETVSESEKSDEIEEPSNEWVEKMAERKELTIKELQIVFDEINISGTELIFENAVN